jgi:hypothetical protein
MWRGQITFIGAVKWLLRDQTVPQLSMQQAECGPWSVLNKTENEVIHLP